jgi:hypothetical protein
LPNQIPNNEPFGIQIACGHIIFVFNINIQPSELSNLVRILVLSLSDHLFLIM